MTWALVETRPNVEMSVSKRFIRQGFSHHLFLHQVSRLRGDRRFTYLLAAFPRYIFIWADNVWRNVLDTEGVLRFLPNHLKQPAIIHPAVVETLIQRALGDILPYQAPAKFQFGDRIRLIDGSNNPLFGYEGIYQSHSGPGRCCILMPWLGALRPVEVDEDEIEKVFAAHHDFRRRRGRRGGRRHRNDRVRNTHIDSGTARVSVAIHQH